MLRMAILDRFRGFIMLFRRSNKKRSEGDQIDNWGYPDSVKPKTFLLTDSDGDHLLTREGPEKVGSFYSKTPTSITETGQKYTHPYVAQSSATVDHVVYSLWKSDVSLNQILCC